MAETAQEKKSSSKLVVILLIVLIVLAAGGIVTAILLNKNSDGTSAEADPEETTAFSLGYEANGVVVIGEDEFNKRMEELAKIAEEGMIDVTYKNVIQSSDGVNFACYIGNPSYSAYDMYFNIYLDYDLDKQMLLTGLIPPGAMIESFESEIPVEPGEHEAMLVFTQVEDDHSTIHGQTKVALVVNVSED